MNIKKPKITRGFLLKLLVLLIIILFLVLIETGILLAIYFPVKASERNTVKDTIDEISDNLVIKINDTINLVKHNLDRNAAFFRINGIYVPETNYTDYIQFDSLPIKNSVESYFWVPKLPFAEKDYYEQFCKDNIYEFCIIHEYDLNDPYYPLLEPVKPRPFYYPIAYAEPILSTGDLLTGFDMKSFFGTAVFVDIALTSVEETASFRVGISQNQNNNSSFSILINKPSTIEHNQTLANTNDIFGIVFGILNIGFVLDDVIEDNIVSINRDDLDIFVFDTTLDGFVNNKTANISLLYKETNHKYKNIWFEDDLHDEDDYGHNHRVFEFLDRKWDIYFYYHDDYINDEEDNLSF